MPVHASPRRSGRVRRLRPATWAALLAALPLVAMTSGCAAPQLGGSPHVRVIPADSLPEPGGGDTLSDERPYLIGPFDRLTIDVFGILELSKREVQTDASGRFSFPLAGVIQAAGKTPAEVEQDLRSKLMLAHIRDPQVTVNLKETGSQFVTVEGQVRKPGLYPVVGRMTLLRAIATAEGTAEFARLDEVVVFRTVEGQKYAALFNLKAIRRGAYADPDIHANDVVVVGDSASRRLFRDVLQVVPLLTTPIVVALQNN
ncbi:polysaccharide biosynthesis/export family protein [Sphingopyxis sp. LK2115]|uniref:polysaccharide biosynthesis/export family protein n=1 Tax=Sphingopyxis sp. LK2115 TaxID=2744558 RepID=UPI001661625E|nr:polysaccharide biosynthesis/export family protein [Sphingopyxis sp. LK2115]